MVKISGGDRLEKALAEMSKKVQKAAAVQIGFRADTAYDDGTPVALVAALNEFGTSKSPPRPFFRGMIQDKSPEWPDALGEALIQSDYDAAKALRKVGLAIEGQLQAAIFEYVGPPLAESTIARKGFDKQLVDTNKMVRSVTSTLTEG